MKLYVVRDIGCGGKVKLYLIGETPQGEYSVSLDVADNKLTGFLEQNKLEKYQIDVKPFIELPQQFFDEFLKLLVDHASQEGVKTENENLLKGKLENTERHLDDMRKIVFKQLGII